MLLKKQYTPKNQAVDFSGIRWINGNSNVQTRAIMPTGKRISPRIDIRNFHHKFAAV